MDSINVNVMVMISYYSFAKGYHWGIWINPVQISILFLKTTFESTVISKSIMENF